jgi:hypothetical protein
MNGLHLGYLAILSSLLYGMPQKREFNFETPPLTEEEKEGLFLRYEKEIACRNNNIPRKLRYKLKGKK